ncbi:MAG TPA: L,D-transpeptidase family protein, partial [Gemmatimonadales bacterium]|nr:L,D-transpeptidase family protein [Gemmatimonadales bacterium]
GGPALRRFLELTGDLPPGPAGPGEGEQYAGELVTGLRRFQQRHGLEPDGVLGRRTRAALRVPFTKRVRQLELALERLRWLPDLRHESFLLVNIPDFTLYAFDAARGTSGLPSRWMRVIVGRAVDTETPIFDEWMRVVIFRPFWNVPTSIAQRELLPQAREDTAWAGRQGYDVVRAAGPEDGPALPATADALDSVAAGTFRFRQRPGPQNALGRVKFIFPNAEAIYLHDTPERGLFARERRDFSHGCIRVEDPAWLAWWVLRDQPAWVPDSVAAALAGPAVPRKVRLTAPLRVIIFYATAAVGPDARVAFYEDVYGHDQALERALAAGPLPAADRAGVEVDEARGGIVPHAAQPEPEAGLPEAGEGDAGDAQVHRLPPEVEAVGRLAAAGAAQHLVGGARPVAGEDLEGRGGAEPGAHRGEQVEEGGVDRVHVAGAEVAQEPVGLRLGLRLGRPAHQPGEAQGLAGVGVNEVEHPDARAGRRGEEPASGDRGEAGRGQGGEEMAAVGVRHRLGFRTGRGEATGTGALSEPPRPDPSPRIPDSRPEA